MRAHLLLVVSLLVLVLSTSAHAKPHDLGPARFLHRQGTRTLTDLQACIDSFQQQPVERQFARELQLAALPTPLRRLIWWWNMHLAGPDRKSTRLNSSHT